MCEINSNYLKLPGSYLFAGIKRRVDAYRAAHPDAKIISLGIGDVTRPLVPAVIEAMHAAVDEMADASTFRGYGPEQGYDFLIDAIIRGEYTARDAHSLLASGHVVLFACGTGSPFFSTDTGAALRAAEIGADVLLLAKNVDGVYSADPRIDPLAVRYSRLTYARVIEENLQATDLTAITLCREQHIPIHVFRLDELAAVCDGGEAGTVIDDGAGVES